MEYTTIFKVFLFLNIVVRVSPFPGGPPQFACDDMTPLHGSPPQDHSNSPFSMSYLTTYFPGETNTISIQSNVPSRTIRGLFLQARPAGDNVPNDRSAIVGTWTLPNDQEDSYKVNQCSNPNDSITHQKPNDDSVVSFLWEAPQDLTGDIQFVMTVVEDFSTFWVQLVGPVATAAEPCDSGPCLNGGSCFNTGSPPYICVCPAEYTGLTCENAVDPCSSAPCQNGGTCFASGGGDTYLCLCTAGFSGSSCNIEDPPCLSSPCNNGGTCLTSTTGDAFACLCTSEFTGLFCNTEVINDPCVSIACSNGNCQSDGITAQCVCPDGFTGTLCETIISVCDPSPCGENGICFGQLDTPICMCLLGYAGTFCDELDNPCLPNNPCQNEGICLPGTAPLEYACQCSPGYYGDNCELADPCASNPCLNSGTCTNVGDGTFQCSCTFFFIGATCDVFFDPCQMAPCINGATCARDARSDLGFTCLCPDSYSGMYCELFTNPDDVCNSSPCINGGTCIPSGNDAFTCLCPLYYVGTTCEHFVLPNACAPNPCAENGDCSNFITYFICQCRNGYTGQLCETAPAPCASNPCQNGGSCIEVTENVYVCDCSTTTVPGFTGLRCEMAPNPCLSNPCLNGGTCYNRITSYDCDCSFSNGYSGERCETPPDPCNSITCLNGGICINGNCDCSNTGYSGINCGILSEACFSNPCKNGATCVEFGTYFQCACTAEFEGIFCESYVDPCLAIPSPCQNGASCTNLQGGQYFCNCLPQYTGTNCETEVNPCASDPCQSGSTCQKTAFGYECQCLPGYGGINCENVIEACISNPCLYGGTCINRPGATYLCLCTSIWEGQNCDEPVDLCQSQPCQNGATCTNHFEIGRAFYQCQCPKGFFGLTCESEINECSSNPCQNSGACIDQFNGYECNCLSGYTGQRCETNINSCSPDPCFNGVCTDLVDGYFCSCNPGFTGTNCEINTDECASNPCNNGGTCLDHNNGFVCFCPINFGGTFCDEVLDCSNVQYTLPDCGAVDITSPNFPNSYEHSKTCQWFLQSPGDNTLSIFLNSFNTEPDFDVLTIGNGASSADVSTIITELSGEILSGTQYISDDSRIWITFTTDSQKSRQGFRLTVTDICDPDLPCDSNPCQNGGTCVDIGDGDSFRCDCLVMFSGDFCEAVRETACDSNPCVNGGTCIATDFGESFICQCYSIFTGSRCETQITATCTPVYCLNGGTCIEDDGTLSCMCPEFFTGERCATEICPDGYCLNNGTCVIDNNHNYRCICPQTHTGDRCNRERDPCENNVCFNGGTCISLDGQNFECQCADGFGGVNCGNVVCPPDYCQNDGLCQVNGTEFICFCLSSYTGEFCEEEMDLCAESRCLNNATCVINEDSTTTSCECATGFAGPFCETEICTRGLCRNGAVCRKMEGQETCFCLDGFAGRYCEIEITPCTSDPCSFGGTCTVGENNTFVCSCPENREGERCMTPVCPPGSCENGANCLASMVDNEDVYICQCPSGYTGERCGEDIDECASNPCLNGGSCINALDRYLCRCQDGFGGNNCQDYCVGNFTCENFGTCRYDNESSSIYCDCLQGYTGERCGIEKNLCEDDPCPVNSVCLKKLNGFLCKCTRSSDSDCRNTVDPPNPCTPGNHECPDDDICVPLFDKYYCNCPTILEENTLNSENCGRHHPSKMMTISKTPENEAVDDDTPQGGSGGTFWWIIVIAMSVVLLFVFLSILTYVHFSRTEVSSTK